MIDSEKAEGCLLGLACGDALGRPVEFCSSREIADRFGTLTTMEADGTWNQPAGTVTDDTDQALCIARSLVERGGFDPVDMAKRFVDWYESDPFDVGTMTARSIRRLKRGQPWDQAGQDVWENSPEGSNAGNGSVMRCPPLAIAYANNPEALVIISKQSSEITHADPRCTYGCALLNLSIAGYLENRNEPFITACNALRAAAPDELVDALDPISKGVQPDSLQTTGYVVHTLQTAYYDAVTADSTEDAIVAAVNRGGDTDTIGAVTGAIAGARFGASDLPDRWLAEIGETEELRTLANRLVEVNTN